MNENIDRIGICPFCDGQGHVLMVKEKESQELYISCDECETQWRTPNDFINNNSPLNNTFGCYEKPTIDEIKAVGWDKYTWRNITNTGSKV